MKTKIISIFLFLQCLCTVAQVYDFQEKYTLDNQISESSGLLYLNNKIITHNDSGDSANLYELDADTGTILRVITVTNATHVDWEDIAESETHIFIGDFGNNSGNRTDLTIYKIRKSDFSESESVTAEIIEFSYEDQTTFSNQSNSHNFDAESLIVYNNHLLIFSKNWQNFTTNVYKLPTDAGTYVAEKVSSANIQGLITGSTHIENKILLCGYTTAAIPFLVSVIPTDNSTFDIFQNGFERYNLVSELGVGSQIEAITAFDSGQFYLSRETLNNQVVNLPAKMYAFKDDRFKTLSSASEKLISVNFSPNPTLDFFKINSPLNVLHVSVFNLLGKKVLSSIMTNEVDISSLKKGMYIVKVTLENNQTFQKKIIKL